MKKLICFILTISLLAGISAAAFASADVENALPTQATKTVADFDPSEYSVEDLLLIDKEIWKAIPVTPTGEILFDEEGIYVEYKGIYEYTRSSWIVDLYIENNSENDVYVTLNDSRCNRFDINFSNNGNKVIADSVYLSSAKNHFIINLDNLKMYDIDKVNTLDFLLDISTQYFGGDTIGNIPVKLIIDKDLPTE